MYKEIELKNDWWLPKCEGDILEGVIVNINDEGTFGREYLLENIDGSGIIKTPAHKVLQKLLEDVKIEDKVRITFKREEPAKTVGKNPTQIYKLEVWEDVKQ